MIAIVLPAFNEEKSIGLLIQNIRRIAKKRLPEGVLIVVVDDGSSDNTGKRVLELSGSDLYLIQHEQNRGLGETLKTGLLYALKLEQQVDTIITMDSDNTHVPGLILRMVMALDEGNDVVIASRYQHGSRILGLSLYRIILSTGMSWLFRLFVPIPYVRDYSCGYRAYRADVLRQAFLTWDEQFISQSGFGCMVDILLKLHHLKAVMTEVPMVLRYDSKEGKSKMKVFKTIRETLDILINEIIYRLRRAGGHESRAF